MDSPRFGPLDTIRCEAEPIRYPGSVQPHGVVLVLDPVSAVIEAASESCTALIGVPAGELLGQSLTSVLGQAARDALMGGDCGKLQPLFSLTLNGQQFTARSLRNTTGQYLIDIEPGQSRTDSPEQLSYNIRSGLEALRRLGSSAEVCKAAAQLIGELTGFDQVMIYRFDARWNGKVIAEAVAPGIEPYMGLHFPASDIPQQARELFKVCRVRLIADVHYGPSALLAHGDAHAFDLGLSSLRSVSPLHIQYLKNMGARATLVCALMIKDRLWELISCQQKNEPRYFSPTERDALGWLCQDISALLEARLQSEHSELEHSLAVRRRRLIHAVRSLEFGELMRAHNNADLLAVVGADGFALIVDQAIQTTGVTPSLERIRQLNQSRLKQHPDAQSYASHALVPDLGPGPGDDAGVAGALFVVVLRQPVMTMIWFRRERSYTLTWGGDPTQPHLVDASGCLTPRTSFQQYLQEVKGQSQEWQPEEVQSAGELVALVEIEALRNSEAFSKTILNSMTEHISVLDENGVIVLVNDAWKRFAADNGAPQLSQSSHGVSYRDICAAAQDQPSCDVASTAWAGIEAVLKRHAASFSLEYPCDSPDQKRWFRMNVYPVRAPANGAIVAHENITPRKQAELARERSEAHWKALVTNDLCGIMAAQNRKIVWANPAFEKMLGYGAGELVGTDTRQGYPSEAAWQAFGAAAYAQLAQGKIYRTETEYVRKDGGHVWVDVSGAVLDAADGQSLWCFVDITDRKCTEQVLKEREQALRWSEERLRSMFSTMVEGVVFQGKDGNIVDANAAAEVLLMLSRDQLLGKASMDPDWHAIREDGSAFPGVQHPGMVTLRTGQPQRNQIMGIERKPGKTRWLSINSQPLLVPGNPLPEAVVASFIDITDRKAAETERKRAAVALMSAKTEAELANNAKSRFLAVVSHDLRQPLAALTLYVDMLNAHAMGRNAQLLPCVKDCVSNLSELLSDLLNVSKLQAEVITPEFTDFAIGDILAALRSVHSAQAENKGLHLRVRSASTMVRTDRALMLRLLGNLVTNAVHYTASGGVLIACRRRDGKQWLEVYDTGIGIDEDQIDFIFGEFTQGANTERNTGSGLGLYIVAKTARLLGLQIRVRSRLGRGSLFAIELPVTDAISHKQDQAPVAQSLTQKKLRVALVEDNTTVLEALRLTLEQLGHAVVAASTGQEAIAKLNGQAPDLIISDYRLDFGETGYDVIEDIRAIFGDALPALIITGDTDPALIKSMAERCITIHYKPLKQEVLLAFINQIKASRPA